jgi:hypothetical protein
MTAAIKPRRPLMADHPSLEPVAWGVPARQLTGDAAGVLESRVDKSSARLGDVELAVA